MARPKRIVAELASLFERIRTQFTDRDDYMRRNEYRTRICLIDPVLRMLGWDVESPELVELEVELARPEGKRADYALKVEGRYIAIVEAKSFDSDLESKRTQKQAHRYACGAGAQHFVLTDGKRWKLYSLNRDTPVENLRPKIELDISSDDLMDLATTALALRRPGLNVGRKLAHVPAPIFEISESDSKGVRPPTQVQFPPKGTTWYPISKVSVERRERPPAWIKFPDGAVMPFVRPGWIGVPFNLVRWLVDTGRLHKYRLPVKRNNGKLLIAASPIGDLREVREGFYMNRGRGSQAHFGDALDLMRQFEIDPTQVFVNFGGGRDL